MLPLATKQSEKLDLFTPLMRSVEESSGPQVVGMVEGSLRRLQQLRDELLQVAAYRNDTAALEKLAASAKTYISMWSGISPSFTFGREKGSIDLRFTWYDSYNREKKTTTSPVTEKLNMLYNLGVIYSQMGTNLVSSVDDRFKDAANCFLTAAWIFDRLKLEAGNIKSPDFGMDLTEQNLHMCSYIMRAQTQYCVHERTKRSKPDAYKILGKIAMQAAEYYGKAYSYVTTPPMCKVLDPKTFVAILQFDEHSFMARAYYWNAMMYFKECEETTMGIGKSIASIRKATEYLGALSKLEKSLSPAVLTMYKDLSKHFAEKRAYLEDQNNKIYHETVPVKAEEVEMLVYGQPISIEADLTKTFEGQEMFARLVPPAVRQLEEEYKREVGDTMNQAFEIARQGDTVEKQFLDKYSLPSCLHAVSGEQTIPEDLWEKIKQCKEKGGSMGLKQILEGVASLSANNEATLNKLAEQLRQEEEEDQAMRTKYGSAWNRLPSQSLNQASKKTLEYYQHKYAEAKVADDKVKNTIDGNKGQFALIELDKSALTGKMPQSKKPAEALSPAAAKLTELLKNLGEMKKAADTAAESLIKSYEAESVTNDMIQIYQQLKDKRATFDELKMKYVKVVKDMEENTKNRQSLYPQIEAAMGEFSTERTACVDSSQRTEFFKSLDNACNSFNECYANAQQGGHFHTQLAGLISKAMQTINDYVVSRTLEKNDLVNQISSQNFTSLGQQNPRMGPPSSGMPPYQPAVSEVISPPPYGGAPGYGARPAYPGYGYPPAAPGYPPAAPGYPPAAPGYAPQQPGYPPQARPGYPGYPPQPRYPPGYGY